MTEVRVKDDGGDTMRMLKLDGYMMPYFSEKTGEELRRLFDDMPTLSMRTDDIMLCSFPKTGTVWLFEVLSMIIAKSAERNRSSKYFSMMEAQTREDMERLPSPRVMNSHCLPRCLPEDLKKKQIKTVLMLRNPKDTAVSYYNHMKAIKMYGYDGQWKNWLPPYLRGEYEYGKYVDFMREWQQIIDKGPEFPLHVLYYEDLKLNGVAEIEKLEKFFEIDLGVELRQSIIEACHFEKMVKEKRMPKEVEEAVFNEGRQFYRKGQVGDWKNWFTVQQNEEFDQIWENEGKCINFQFKYTDGAHQGS